MSIRDMLDNGVQIQGNISIKTWDDEREDYEIHYEGEYMESLWAENYFDKEIKYIYCVDNTLIIEF